MRAWPTRPAWRVALEAVAIRGPAACDAHHDGQAERQQQSERSKRTDSAHGLTIRARAVTNS